MRGITDRDGLVWTAELVSHGRTSGYLNPKVHRPVVQFTCQSARRARMYASLPPNYASLEVVSDEGLVGLLAEAQSH